MSKIIDGFKESIQTASEISKTNHNDIKEMSKELRSRGVVEGFKQSAKEAKESSKQFTKDAICLKATKEFLQDGIITIPTSGVGRSKKSD